MMLVVSRVVRGHRVAASPVAREVEAPPWEAWADTLALLVRSHRARLAAPDPSRPWSTLTPPVPEHQRS